MTTANNNDEDAALVGSGLGRQCDLVGLSAQYVPQPLCLLGRVAFRTLIPQGQISTQTKLHEHDRSSSSTLLPQSSAHFDLIPDESSMEDEDEFGDLYTDVIQSFPSSSPSSFAAPLQKSSVPAQSGPRAIDLNFQLDEEDDDDECGDAAAGTSNSGVARAASGGGGLELTLSGAAVSSGRELDVRDRGVGDDGENRELGKTTESGGDFDEGSFRFDLEEEAQDGNGDVGSEKGTGQWFLQRTQQPWIIQSRRGGESQKQKSYKILFMILFLYYYYKLI
uniref:Uncharacterized protein n=1 Tax=Kalanchoe fedtschenkoi TaxID=63787 RepID=A0A7N0RAZ6_KALFE